MFNRVSIDWSAQLTNLALVLLIIGAGLLLWWLLWLREHGFFFEEGHYNFEARRGSRRRQSVTTFSEYYNRMSRILKDMDYEYWIKVGGMDGIISS